MGKNELYVVLVDIKELKPYEKNPRKNDAAVDYVKNSIEAFGWKVPIVVDKNKVIIAGHTRYKAAKKLGLKEVPCVIADDLTEEQANAFRLIDNKTQELSSWDFGKLIDELDALVEEFNMNMFGFDNSKADNSGIKSESFSRQDLNGGVELNMDDFSDDQFNCECPACGFRFND